MNVPAAIAMITISFPDPAERGRAYAIYSALGAVGNVCGFVLGGVLTARLSWRWGPFFSLLESLSSCRIDVSLSLLPACDLNRSICFRFVVRSTESHESCFHGEEVLRLAWCFQSHSRTHPVRLCDIRGQYRR